MGIKELRQKSKTELQRVLVESKDKLRQLRFDLANKKLKNTSMIKENKKDIARALTLLKIKD